MKKIIAAFLIFFSVTQAQAEKLSAADFTVSIELQDNATGACWTNLKETREYAEEKLQMKGFSLGDFKKAYADKNQYTLLITVTSNRNIKNYNLCEGSVNVSFETKVLIHEKEHLARLAGLQTAGINIRWNNTTVALVQMTLDSLDDHFH